MTTTAAPTTTTLSEILAKWAVGLTIDDVPEPVLAAAKDHALDALGIAIASTGMDYGRAMHRASVELGAGNESGAIGFGTRLPAPSAALLNGTLIHGLDFDDTHIGAIYHATGPALATALAVGEAEHADGATVLLAYIVGLEVGCRMAGAGAGLFHARGFHPTGIAGTFAPACVPAKIRGPSADEVTSALGLCGSQAAGILALHDSWLKRMHPGWAAHAGLIAATMAKAGFRGPSTVLEGSAGLYRSHLEKIPSSEDLGLQNLGEHWMTAEIALKPYPCCHFTHAFAERLERSTRWAVREAEPGDLVASGQVLVAPGAWSLRVARDGGSLRVLPPLEGQSRSITPSSTSVSPSVAVALTSESRLASAGPNTIP